MIIENAIPNKETKFKKQKQTKNAFTDTIGPIVNWSKVKWAILHWKNPTNNIK